MPKKQKRTKNDKQREPSAEPPRLAKLTKAWAKASEEEREAFLAQLAEAGRPMPVHQEQKLIANGRYLLPSTVVRVERIMRKRGIGPEAVSEELGSPGGGKNLTRALARGASLRLSIVQALGIWLEKQETPPERTAGD